MGSGRLSSLVLSDEFGSLGINTDCDSYWEISLGVADCGRDMIILTCGVVVLEVQWSVRDRGSYEWVPKDCPPWCYPMSLVVLRQI